MFLLTACSGGGGGGGGIPAVSQAPTTTTTTTQTFTVDPNGVNSSTGIPAGPIAAPPAGSFGTAPKQIATAGGPTFNGSSGGYPANVTFPMISTTLLPGSSGLTAGAANTGATLTVLSTSANSSSFQMVIPAVNVNFTFTNRENIANNMDGITWGLNYAVAGAWAPGGNSTGPMQSSTAFVFGYETPSSAMPSTGTASFSGSASGTVYKNIGSNVSGAQVFGNAAVSVNFASGQVNGALTQMQQWGGMTSSTSSIYLPWNDVSLTANIAAGTNRFSGSTAATSAPGSAFSLAGSATGKIDGAFFGPTPQNVGAIWSLSDGAGSALGALTAK